MRSIVRTILVMTASLWLCATGAAYAQDCAAGYYSANGQEPCNPCVAGYYQDQTGQTSCNLCGAGTYSTGAAASCSCCPAGTASPFVGASSCNPCGSGTYELSTCSTACDPCPGGQATPCNNNGTCSDGPSGNGTCSCFVGYTGFACENATQCAAGYYSATGNEPCSPCLAGTYAPITGSTSCSQCLPGTYSGSAAATCDCCPAGTSSAIFGASSCSPCGSGTYELSTCSTGCDPCPGGQATPCNNNGTCSDGPSGNGTCSCFVGYTGFACENGPPPSSTTTTTIVTPTTTLTTTTTVIDGCPLFPREFGCVIAQMDAFQIKKNADPSKNQLKWKWNKGPEVFQSYFGAPNSVTNYFFCIYDTNGVFNPTLEAELEIPYSLFWADKDPKGWSYKDKYGTQDGVTKIQLKPGGPGKSKAQLGAKGAAIPMPVPFGGGDYFDQDPKVVVELYQTDGTCWSSTFTAADTKTNEEDAFKAIAK